MSQASKIALEVFRFYSEFLSNLVQYRFYLKESLTRFSMVILSTN